MLYGFSDGLHQLCRISSHGNGGHVHVRIGHHQSTQILLSGLFASVSELRGGAHGSGLGGLPTGVGIHLRVHHEYIDVLTGSDDVIQASVANIIGPAIAAKEPYHLLAQLIPVQQDVVRQASGLSGELRRLQGRH